MRALLPVLVVLSGPASGREALLEALRHGGHVIVMRHASSPREVPAADTAGPGNFDRERQLDEAGRRSAAAMGIGLRAARIPIASVLSSPTFRALQTARYAQLPLPETHDELGDGGQSMQGVTAARAAWLRNAVRTAPHGRNVLIITHQPNIAAAFPGLDPAPADGEALVFRPAAAAATLVGRLRIEEWGPPLPPPRPVSLTTSDGASIQGDLYGSGPRAVVLAHGGRFDRDSWIPQAQALATAGFRVLAFDFRGRGRSTGPGAKGPREPPLADDVLAAVRYLHEGGARTVAVVGGSMGGSAAADALSRARPGEIDRVVLLAAAGGIPEKMTGRKLFILCRHDSEGEGQLRLPRIRALYDQVPSPKQLVVLECSAHAQEIFQTDQAARLMNEITTFLTAP